MRSSRVDDPLRLGLGTALKCCQKPYHRCVIVSDPQRNGDYLVLVRITTNDGKWPDQDCILTPEEWYYAGSSVSRNPCNWRMRVGCRILRSALASIWRMRSRVTLNCLPTSSSVRE